MPARPRPRPRSTPVSEDSDDGFNLCRVRERQIERQITRSPSIPTSEPDAELEMRIGDPINLNPISSVVDRDPEAPQDNGECMSGDTEYLYIWPGSDHGIRYWSIPPIPGESSAASRRTRVRDEKTRQWVPIAPGYCAPSRSPYDEEEAQAAEEKAVVAERAAHMTEAAEVAEMAEAQEMVEGDSGSSGSNFSDDRRAKEQVRAKKRVWGKEVSDTEAKDEEDDHQLAGSVIPEAVEHRTQKGIYILVRSYNQTTDESEDHRPAPASSKFKGKGRAVDDVDMVDDMSEHDLMDDMPDLAEVSDTDDEEEELPTKGRRFTKAEKKETDELGRRVVEDADQLANKYGRKRGDVLVRAGLGTKLARKDNLANIYKKWYAMKNDKPVDCN
jgi:hypothetical protein